MPLAASPSPDGRFVVLSLGGWREQGLEVLDRKTGNRIQHVEQPGAFLGLAWSADGRTLYASGGVADAVFALAWNPGAPHPAEPVGRIELGPGVPGVPGSRYPAGLAVSADGRALYVAENLGDSLAVVDLPSGRVLQRLAAGRYPYAVAAAGDGHVYVSAWGESAVHVFARDGSGLLAAERPIDVGRHPSALALNIDASRLFVASASTDRVAVVDTRARRVLRWLLDPPLAGVTEGSTPDALALAPDGTRLFVAEADNNAVAVFELSAASAGVASARGGDALAGRIPSGWYPTDVLPLDGTLWIVNGKGWGSGPNPAGPQPNVRLSKVDPRAYTLGQLDGSVTVVPLERGAALEDFSRRVAHANGWDFRGAAPPRYPPFEHVLYVIKENRTFDQVLGDLPQADGDATLTFFPRELSPNHHALAERFGIYDRFFVNAEVSQQGHPWSTAGYVTDYSEKTTPDIYRQKRPEPDEPGDVDDPANGYLWDRAARKGLWVRNYGEYTEPVPRSTGGPGAPTYRALLPTLQADTSPTYPSFDPAIPDQRRADVWLGEFREHERTGKMPALEIMHLPADHTAGARPGRPTPKACMADNDLALGRIVEAISRSRFWRTTAIFVLEDDAQDGPDHVDSHRSVLLTLSAWSRGGVRHRFVNTTDVLQTIEEILALEPMSQFDHFGRPLREIWTASPDLTPYRALTSTQPLDELNLASAPEARRSEQLALRRADQNDDDTLNRILWSTLKGPGMPYPAPRRAALQEYVRGR